MPQYVPLLPSVFSYRISTVLADVPIFIDARWNGRDGAWYVNVLDADETMIRAGIKLVAETLIGGREYDPRWPPGTFVVSDWTGGDTDPGFDAWGETHGLYFYGHDE